MTALEEQIAEMTDAEFDALPHRQTIEQLCEWRAGAPLGAFCCAWTERVHATHHAEERSAIMRVAHSWREAGLVLTFWKRVGDCSHLLVQKRALVDVSGEPARVAGLFD